MVVNLCHRVSLRGRLFGGIYGVNQCSNNFILSNCCRMHERLQLDFTVPYTRVIRVLFSLYLRTLLADRYFFGVRLLKVFINHPQRLENFTKILKCEDNQYHLEPGGVGYSPKFWCAGVPHGSQNPDPISDQNI